MVCLFIIMYLFIHSTMDLVLIHLWSAYILLDGPLSTLALLTFWFYAPLLWSIGMWKVWMNGEFRTWGLMVPMETHDHSSLHQGTNSETHSPQLGIYWSIGMCNEWRVPGPVDRMVCLGPHGNPPERGQPGPVACSLCPCSVLSASAATTTALASSESPTNLGLSEITQGSCTLHN